MKDFQLIIQISSKNDVTAIQILPKLLLQNFVHAMTTHVQNFIAIPWPQFG